VRYRIETVFGQLVSRCDSKRVWARGLWRLGNRLLRKVLIHRVVILLNVAHDHPPLQLALLVV